MVKAVKGSIKVSDIPLTSSFVDPSLSWGVTHGVTPGDCLDPDPILQSDFTDILDDDFDSLLSKAPVLKTVSYVSTEPLTTLAYKTYRTTTAWRAILAFNGYMHEMEIPEGAELKLPDLDYVSAGLKKKVIKPGRLVIF